MTTRTLDRVGYWTRSAGLLGLAALAWALFVPGGVFWAGLLAGCLIGSSVAVAMLMRGPARATLTQLIGGTGAEPVVGLSGPRRGTRLCPRGEGTP